MVGQEAYGLMNGIAERRPQRLIIQYNPSERDRAIFAKGGEMGTMAVRTEHSLNQEVMHSSEAWRSEGVFHLGTNKDGTFKDAEMDPKPGDSRANLAHELRLSAKNKTDLKERQAHWNHEEWQGHILGTKDTRSISNNGKERTWMPAGIARGTEHQPKADELAKAAKDRREGNLVTVYEKREPWTNARLAKENPNSLYKAWSVHRGKVRDNQFISRVDHANEHGIGHDDASVVEARKHLLATSTRLGALDNEDRNNKMGRTAQEVAQGELDQRGTSVERMQGHYLKLVNNVKRPDGSYEAQHWYEGAHVYTREIAQRYGISHDLATGIIAAHSPNTEWGKNRELLIRTLELQRENPLVHVDQAHIDGFQRLQDKREKKANSMRSTSIGYAEKQAARIDQRLPADFKPGMYHVNDLPPELVATTMSLGTLGGNTARALNVLRSGNVERYVQGPKISAFHNNIGDPFSDKSITIDIHAARGAVNGDILNWKEKGGKIVRRPYGHEGDENSLLSGDIPGEQGAGIMPGAQEALFRIASRLELPPSAVQAIAWHSIKQGEGGSGEVNASSKDKAYQKAKARVKSE